MSKKQTNGLKKRTLVVLFFITWLIFGIFNITYSYAEDTYEHDHMRKGNNILAAEIYSGNAAGTGDLTAMKGADVIGFDTLYGTSQRDTTYTGETPGSYGDAYSDYPHMLNGWVGNYWRVWWQKPEDIVDEHEKLGWSNSQTKDLHAYLLVSQSNANGLQIPRLIAGFVFGLFSCLNAPFAFILRLVIQFANFDVNTISEALHLSDPNSKDSIARKISNAFTMDADNGNTMSPLLILAFAMFLIGLAGLAARYIFGGKTSKHELLQEIVFCFIAFILIGVGATNGYSVLISKAGELTQAVVSGISQSQGDEDVTKLYQYQTNQGANADLNYYMDALTAKSYIETVIYSQFGYPADELYLWGGGETNKLWGISENDMKDIVKRIGDTPGMDYKDKNNGHNNGKGINAFTVWTGLNYENGNPEAPNVGYWWYAVTSGVDPYEPFTKDENGNIQIKKGDVKMGLLVMDLVSAIYAKTNDAAAKAKCKKVMDTFFAHDWKWPEMGLNILVTIALIAGIFFFSVFAFVFKLFFNVGFIIIPIIPILLLIKKTRPTARKILGSWVSSAIIFSLCLVCMCTILYISSSLTQSGWAGIIVDFGLLVGATVLAPRLVQLILSIPKKAGMEGLSATETVIQKGNQYMGSLQQNRRKAQGDIQNKHNHLKEEKIHHNTSDMTTFNDSDGIKTHHKKGASEWDSEARFELINKAATDSNTEEVVKKLKSEEWEDLQNKTGKDLAILAATSDSEVLKKNGCSEEFITAMEHKEERDKKKEERKEALEKRREEVRRKRVEFYRNLHLSRTATLLSHTRLGNQALGAVMAFEEKKAEHQEKNFKRKAKNGYRSKLNIKDIKEKHKEKKEIKAEGKTLHEAELKAVEGRAKLSSDIVSQRIAEAQESHEKTKGEKTSQKRQKIQKSVNQPLRSTKAKKTTVNTARIKRNKARQTAEKIKETSNKAHLHANNSKRS